jgi:hypothetical protein
MLNPTAAHRLRALTAIEHASMLIGAECMRADGSPDIAEFAAVVDARFDLLDDGQIQDVGKSLVAILRHQVGPTQAEILVAALPPGDTFGVAQLVAQTIGLDGWTALRSCETATAQAQFWRIADGIESDEPPPPAS